LSQKSKIACCAFFIAVTSNVGMNVMVDSFRQATQQWLQQRLVADLYVTTEEPALFNTWLQAQPINIGIYPRQSMEAKLLDSSAAATVELRSYPSTQLYREALSFAEVHTDAWQLFSSGSGVFINQQLALRHNLSLNDKLHFQAEQSTADNKVIVGIYYDYGNQSPQAYLPSTAFTQDLTNTNMFALHFESLAQQQDFSQRLAATASLKQVNSITSKDLLAVSMRTFERTFVITDGLNIVTLLVAALSLATSVLMIDMDNRPQRALMRSLGLGHYRIAALSLTQYTLLSALTCLIAIPFGLILTWLLINLINVQAFSWSYPMLISSDKLLYTCTVSLSLIVIVVALPLYQLSRRKLIEDIKCIQS
jgi:putative ABC transport system permease protein